MSRSYRIYLSVEGIPDKETADKVVDALRGAVHCTNDPDVEVCTSSPHKDTEPGPEDTTHVVYFGCNTQLSGGETEGSESDKIAHAVWKAAGQYVEITANWWFDEREPDEIEYYDDVHYEDWLEEQERDADEESEAADVSHVVVDASVQPPVMRCLHCGEVEGIGLPVTIDKFSRRANEYTKEHAKCVKKESSE